MNMWSTYRKVSVYTGHHNAEKREQAPMLRAGIETPFTRVLC